MKASVVRQMYNIRQLGGRAQVVTRLQYGPVQPSGPMRRYTNLCVIVAIAVPYAFAGQTSVVNATAIEESKTIKVVESIMELRPTLAELRSRAYAECLDRIEDKFRDDLRTLRPTVRDKKINRRLRSLLKSFGAL